MARPNTMKELEELGRVRLSPNFYMREMLYSEIANFHGLPNIPDDPELAIVAGTRLCEDLLEPLHATFGRVCIRSAFRCAELNEFGVQRKSEGYSCGRTQWNYARHIWDHRDGEGFMGATACIVIPWFAQRYAAGTSWQALAWWIHDNLPYSHMAFYPIDAAFNLRWYERPTRHIEAFVEPFGCLTQAGMANHEGDHSSQYAGFPTLK